RRPAALPRQPGPARAGPGAGRAGADLRPGRRFAYLLRPLPRAVRQGLDGSPLPYRRRRAPAPRLEYAMFRETLKPPCLVGLSVLAAPLLAQSPSATQQLVNQGNYWQDQGREDLAAEAWRKLLAVDPNQPDALLGLALIDLNQGRRAEAQRRLTQLQSSHPDSPQATRLRMALGGGGGSNNALQTARRAAAAGRYAEAVRAYDQAFGKGGPPDDLALEYYQVLAGTPDGWERARDGLRRVAGNSNSPAASLALGQ